MSQFESIDRVLKKGRLELQEVKKKFQTPPDPWDDGKDDSNVKTENETKRNRKKIVKKYGPKPETETPKNEKPSTYEKLRTKHQKERAKIEQKRTQYGLKPDSRGVYKPTKPGLKSSLTNQIK